MNKEILFDHINDIHTTEMGIIRIKKNLNINNVNVVDYIKNLILNSNNIIKRGKNWYVECNNYIITINSYSYTIITAHIKS